MPPVTSPLSPQNVKIKGGDVTGGLFHHHMIWWWIYPKRKCIGGVYKDLFNSRFLTPKVLLLPFDTQTTSENFSLLEVVQQQTGSWCWSWFVGDAVPAIEISNPLVGALEINFRMQCLHCQTSRSNYKGLQKMRYVQCTWWKRKPLDKGQRCSRISSSWERWPNGVSQESWVKQVFVNTTNIICSVWDFTKTREGMLQVDFFSGCYRRHLSLDLSTIFPPETARGMY